MDVGKHKGAAPRPELWQKISSSEINYLPFSVEFIHSFIQIL